MENYSDETPYTLFNKSRVFLFILGLLGLALISRYNYLLFHSLAEIFSIIIASGIFIIAWNSRRFQENHYLLFLGIAYLFIGTLDLFHTLSYRGMNIFHAELMFSRRNRRSASSRSITSRNCSWPTIALIVILNH